MLNPSDRPRTRKPPLEKMAELLRQKGRSPQRIFLRKAEGTGEEQSNLWIAPLLKEGEVSAVALAQVQSVIWQGEEVLVGELLLESASSLSEEVIPLYHQALDYLDEQGCLCALTFTPQPEFFYQWNWVDSARLILLEKEVLNPFESRFSLRPLEEEKTLSPFLQRLFPLLVESHFPIAKKLPPISPKDLWIALWEEEIVGFCHLISLGQAGIICHLTTRDEDYNDLLFALEQQAYQAGWKRIYVYTFTHSVPFQYLTALNYQVVEGPLEDNSGESLKALVSLLLNHSWNLLTLGVPVEKGLYYELSWFPFLAPPLMPCDLVTEGFRED